MIQQPRPAPLTCWEKVGVCCGCVSATSMAALALVSSEVQEHVEARLLPGSTVRGYRARALLFPHENRGSCIGTLHVMLIEAAGVKNCDLCGTNAFATLRLGAQWQRSLTKSRRTPSHHDWKPSPKSLLESAKCACGSYARALASPVTR